MGTALMIFGAIFCISGMNALMPDDAEPFTPYWERALIFALLFGLGLTSITFGATP